MHKSIVLFTKLKISESNSVCLRRATIYRSNITANGSNNSVDINGGIFHSKLEIEGSNNEVNIMDGVEIINGKIIIKGDNLKFTIEQDSTSLKGFFVLMGKNNYIKIGKGCMLAEGTNIWASDSHPIFEISDLTVPVNPSSPIEIGDHVWVGKDSAILKGTCIGDDAIIGMKSVVTKDVPNGTIVAGSPARQIKSGMTWKRNHITV